VQCKVNSGSGPLSPFPPPPDPGYNPSNERRTKESRGRNLGECGPGRPAAVPAFARAGLSMARPSTGPGGCVCSVDLFSDRLGCGKVFWTDTRDREDIPVVVASEKCHCHRDSTQSRFVLLALNPDLSRHLGSRACTGFLHASTPVGVPAISRGSSPPIADDTPGQALENWTAPRRGASTVRKGESVTLSFVRRLRIQSLAEHSRNAAATPLGSN